MEFLAYNYGKEKLKRLFHLGDFLNCKDNQERSSRMIWELVLLYVLWFNFILGSNFLFFCFWVW